jgi:endonuclease YncB( thermonuclease family)
MLVNGELVRLGFAEAVEYLPDTKYQDLFTSWQEESKKAERGIWTISPTITPPTKPETDKIIPPPRD